MHRGRRVGGAGLVVCPRPRFVEAVVDPLADDVPLVLGHGHDDRPHEPPGRGASVEVLVGGDEGDRSFSGRAVWPLLQGGQKLHEIGRAPHDPVQSDDQDGVHLAGVYVGLQALEGGAVRVGPAPAVYVLINDGPASGFGVGS